MNSFAVILNLQPQRKQILHPGDTIRTTAPFYLMLRCPDCGRCKLFHTPAPRQIQVAAVKLLPVFSLKVHCDEECLASGDSDPSMELKAAMAMYSVQEIATVARVDDKDDSSDEHSEEEDIRPVKRQRSE